MPVSTAFLNAASRARCKPVYIVRIYLDDETPELGVNLFAFASAMGWTYPASVDGVGEVAVSFDPVDRERKIASRTVTFRAGDGVFRRLATSIRLKNKKLEVLLGFPGLLESEFAKVCTAVITDIIPRETEIEVVCEDVDILAAEVKYKNTVVNLHPFEVLEAMLDDLVAFGGLDANAYDATELDPSAAGYEDISHWNVGWDNFGDVEDFWEPTVIGELVADLVRACSCYFGPDEEGVWRLRRHVVSAEPVATWRREDIKSFEQKSTWESFYNRFVFDTCQAYTFEVIARDAADDTDTEPAGRFVHEDATSQSAYAYPGRPVYREERSIESRFLNAIGTLSADSDPLPPQGPGNQFILSDTESFCIANAGYRGFCGARFEPVGPGYSLLTSQPSWSRVFPASPRRVYLMLCGDNVRQENPGDVVYVNGRPEIVKIDLVKIDEETDFPDEGDPATYIEHNTVKWPRNVRFYFDLTASNAGRAQFEDTPSVPNAWRVDDGASGFLRFVDVTIPVYWAEQHLARFKDGAPVVELRTDLSKIDVQLGQFVVVEDDTLINYGLEGSGVFEVVSKQVQAVDPTPGIVWGLVFVRAAA